MRARRALVRRVSSDIRNAPARVAALSPEVEADRATGQRFLYDNLYNSPGRKKHTSNGSPGPWQDLFAAFSSTLSQLLPTPGADSG